MGEVRANSVASTSSSSAISPRTCIDLLVEADVTYPARAAKSVLLRLLTLHREGPYLEFLESIEKATAVRTLESLARIEAGAEGGALQERTTTTRTAKDGTTTTTVRKRTRRRIGALTDGFSSGGIRLSGLGVLSWWCRIARMLRRWTGHQPGRTQPGHLATVRCLRQKRTDFVAPARSSRHEIADPLADAALLAIHRSHDRDPRNRGPGRTRCCETGRSARTPGHLAGTLPRNPLTARNSGLVTRMGRSSTRCRRSSPSPSQTGLPCSSENRHLRRAPHHSRGSVPVEPRRTIPFRVILGGDHQRVQIHRLGESETDKLRHHMVPPFRRQRRQVRWFRDRRFVLWFVSAQGPSPPVAFQDLQFRWFPGSAFRYQ